jgi:hypothetical protein
VAARFQLAEPALKKSASWKPAATFRDCLLDSQSAVCFNTDASLEIGSVSRHRAGAD